jgi:hypothetical protein
MHQRSKVLMAADPGALAPEQGSPSGVTAGPAGATGLRSAAQAAEPLIRFGVRPGAVDLSAADRRFIGEVAESLARGLRDRGLEVYAGLPLG